MIIIVFIEDLETKFTLAFVCSYHPVFLTLFLPSQERIQLADHQRIVSDLFRCIF
jgi:hypothetical protein